MGMLAQRQICMDNFAEFSRGAGRIWEPRPLALWEHAFHGQSTAPAPPPGLRKHPRGQICLKSCFSKAQSSPGAPWTFYAQKNEDAAPSRFLTCVRSCGAATSILFQPHNTILRYKICTLLFGLMRKLRPPPIPIVLSCSCSHQASTQPQETRDPVPRGSCPFV